MNPCRRLLIILIWAGTLLACGRRVVNVEKTQVDKVIGEFTEERMYYYLRGGGAKSNADIMEKVLARHSLRLIEFRPALRRFYPEISTRLLGS
jgi:CRISPR/Cas system-associated protein Cas5 (RAMP superfamily)